MAPCANINDIFPIKMATQLYIPHSLSHHLLHFVPPREKAAFQFGLTTV